MRYNTSPQYYNVEVKRNTRLVETIEVDLSAASVDPLSEVELSISSPDGRIHKVRVNPTWFIPEVTL